MVRIIVGQDDEGNQLVYEAGDDNFRVLEVENPWGTQQMANDMLARIQGYAYQPYTADGAMLDPAAELGDAVTAGLGDNAVYSVINNTETTISPIMSANIAAREDSNINHEYPYEDKTSREITRKVNGLRTSFTVQLGKIESTITDEVNGLSSRITQTQNSIIAEVTRATAEEGRLSSRITQTADAITAEVTRATQAEGTLSSRITQTAESISAEVTRATEAEGTLSSRITQTADSITSEVTRATQAENALSSRITQTASEIRAEVNGIYADEWVVGTGPESSYYYNPGDVVKVTDEESITYYKCIQANDSNSNNKPGSGAFWGEYWEVTTPSSVQSMVDLGLDGITLGYQASTMENSATITLNKNGIQMQAQTITMSNVVADELSADYIFSDGMTINGAFTVRAEYQTNRGGTVWRDAGAIGAAFGNDGVIDTKGCMLRSAYYRGDYHYVIATSGPSGGVRMQAGDYSLYVTEGGVFASDGTNTKNLLS